MSSQSFYYGFGGYVFFQVEGFEVGNILELLVLPLFKGGGQEVLGGDGRVEEAGVGERGEQFATFGHSVAAKENGLDFSKLEE